MPLYHWCHCVTLALVMCASHEVNRCHEYVSRGFTLQSGKGYVVTTRAFQWHC
jgi:hypothetical protein